MVGSVYLSNFYSEISGVLFLYLHFLTRRNLCVSPLRVHSDLIDWSLQCTNADQNKSLLRQPRCWQFTKPSSKTSWQKHGGFLTQRVVKPSKCTCCCSKNSLNLFTKLFASIPVANEFPPFSEGILHPQIASLKAFMIASIPLKADEERFVED